jgi:HD-GYP domain-containing protein (c-di-GMP phosphodiesterase class II)
MMNVKSLIRFDAELNRIQDLDLLLERILLDARRVVHADAGSIYIKELVREGNRQVEKLKIKYAQNDTQQKTLPQGQKLIYSIFSVAIDNKSMSGYCALTQQSVNVPDVYHLPPNAPYFYNLSFDRISGYKTTSILTIPLKTTDGHLLGVIQMINALDYRGTIIPFSKEDEQLVSYFAIHASLALQRAQMLRIIIMRMIKLSELRDPRETGTHINRVASYAVEIYDCWAERHGIPWEERQIFRDHFKIGTMFHDAGKVAISDAILKKPALLTEEEFLIMQRHTLYGAELFERPQLPLDTIAREVAFTHHENWDGTGYPRCKKGEEIPLTGRIVAIADVFDALCSKRVYKNPWNEEQVLMEIRRLSGTKFDPELVEIFFDILPNIKQIQRLYPETEI